ncbi:MAG: 2-C-methyl-D-erythritol 4-phosphate cytidylyltransferase [Desulfobacterales bacterium]|nr:2-C-methyl-D-erythritol 4-phosphate cytidylyltransferase [Desulfobacterales bacterium]
MASAVIVAAGRGVRMCSPVAKQFLALGDIPVLARTLQVFAAHPRIADICLVVPDADFAFCRQSVLPLVQTQKPVKLTAGGAKRQDSVQCGLNSLDRPEKIVVIHDGVRPFVTAELISGCIDKAAETGACIAGIPAAETLKQVGAGNMIVQTVSRDGIWLAQTPQAFDFGLIQRAFEKAGADGFLGTDDASLVERMGVSVAIIEGSRSNIKITTPADLEMAARLLQNQSTSEADHEQ